MLTTLFIVAGIAAASALFGVGGGVDPYKELLVSWEKGISKSVEDDAREDEALKVVEDARTVLADARLKQGEATKQLFEVDEKYDAALEDYEPAIEALSEVWAQQDNQLMEQRFKVKAILTDAEFAAVTEVVKKKMAGVKEDVDDELEDSREDHDDQLEDIEKAERKAAEKNEK